MSDNTAVESFIAAQNFCTGSQTDYSTCIANNMRFTPFLDDTYKASDYVELAIRDQDLPLLYGDVYVDLVPLAIANIFSRVKMTNSFGVVSFRCSEVFDRPRLPLPNLQDLGIPSQDIVNIIGIDPEDPETDPEDALMFEGVPITPDDSLLGSMLNYMNLLIGYTTAVSHTITKGKEIKGIILGMLNYYSLPLISEEMEEQADSSYLIYNEAVRYMNLVYNDSEADQQLKDIINTIKTLGTSSESYMSTIRSEVSSDVVIPLSSITEDTDFAFYDFTITEGVVEILLVHEEEFYPFVFSYAMQAKLDSVFYGRPPLYPKDLVLVNQSIVDTYGSVIRNLVANSLQLITKLYSVTTTMYTVLDSLRANELFWLDTKANRSFFVDSPRAAIPTSNVEITDKYEEYQATIDKIETLLDTFAFDNLMNTVEGIYDPEDTETIEEVSKIVDAYFDNTGNVSNIALADLIDKQQILYNTVIDDRITEVFLGGDYKDAGNFYYADIAYAVGYAKLSDIKSIQIDDEYYILEDENLTEGSGGISEGGCTRYSFTRHVLPTYEVAVDMYIYPGTPDQPYCPTVNRYHNFLSSKYYGMFTKMAEEGMGVYIYRGYKPMYGTIEEVIQIGEMDLNSINLNDPSLDQKSYEAMLMKEVKNLTNSSSINDKPISTEDLKYYLSSVIVDEEACSNYPGLAIIEFKNFPLGPSPKFPKIKVNVVSEDLV